MEDFRIFKIYYEWYEDDHGEVLLGKNSTTEEFEKDIAESAKFAESLIGIEIKDYDNLGKGYCVDCLPEYYEQIVWYLTSKKGYIYCYFNEDTQYKIENEYPKKIIVNKRKDTVVYTKIPESSETSPINTQNDN